MISEPFQVSDPFQVGDDTFVVPVFWHTPGAPVGVHLNSMVLRGPEPVLFDTSVAVASEDWCEKVFSLVEPADVRWIVLTHDDPDHVGNVARAVAECPNATVVTTWFMTERMSPETPFDPRRLRWVGPGGTLDVGDRTLQFVRPPLYDSPTTRIVMDPTSGVLWAGDLFAVPVPTPTNEATDLEPDQLQSGFFTFQNYNSPWVDMLDRNLYGIEVDKLAALAPTAIASTHGPAFLGDQQVDLAMDLLRQVPGAPVQPEPDQAVLDGIVAGIAAGAKSQ